MQTFSQVCFCFNLFIVFWRTPSGVAVTENTCAELQVIGRGSDYVVLKAVENGYVNISVKLRTHKCENTRKYFKVKFLATGKSKNIISVPLCTIFFQEESCNVTDHSSVCHCSDKETFRIFHKVSRSQTMYELEWTDLSKSTVQKKTYISVILNEDERQVTLKILLAASICAIIFVITIVVCIVCIARRRINRGQRADSDVLQQRQGEEGYYHCLQRRRRPSPTATVQDNSNNPRNAEDAREPGSSTLARGHDPGPCQHPEEQDGYMEPLTPMAVLMKSLKKRFENQS